MSAEATLRRLLTPLFALLFLANLWVALKLCLHANAFGVLDWLINYRGGFVRRGLLGELLLWIHRLSGVSPIALVFLVQTICTATFFGFSHALLRRRSHLLPFALLILSPFLLRFAIHDEQGSFRKEILFFGLLALNAWSVVTAITPTSRRRARWILWTSLFVYPLLVLTHEVLALYLPILVGLHGPRAFRSRAAALGLLSALGLSALALICAVTTEVEPAQLQAIARSWPVDADASRGALGWLADSSALGRARVAQAVHERNYPQIYTFVLLAGAVAFWPLRRHLAWRHHRWAWFGLAISTAATVPLLVTALDWGRFANTLFVSAFLVCAATPSADPAPDSDPPREKPERLHWAKVAFAIVYASSWHIPHCCGDSPLSRSLLRAWSALTRAGVG